MRWQIGITFVCLIMAAPVFAVESDGYEGVDRIAGVVVTGSSIYSDYDLLPLYKEFFGRALEPDIVVAIRERIAGRYQDDGFFRPGISAGVLKDAAGLIVFRVNEPVVDEVVIVGDASGIETRLEKYAAPIKASRPLSRELFQKNLLLMNRLAGVTVNPSVELRSDSADGYTLTLDVVRNPVQFFANLDNRGNERVGEELVYMQLSTSDLIGANENLDFIVESAADFERYHYFGFAAERPVGRNGGSLRMLISSSRAEPEESSQPIDDKFARNLISLLYRHPLVLDGLRSTYIESELTAYNLTKDIDDLTVRDDRVRRIAVGVVQSGFTDRSRISFSFFVTKGLDALGAELFDTTQLVPRNHDFLRWNFGLIRQRSVSQSWSTRLDLLAQYSNDMMPDTERFLFGGDLIGGAYDPAELSGDSGLAGRYTVRRVFGQRSGSYGRSSLYAYYDLGATWLNNVRGSTGDSAASLAFGYSYHRGGFSGDIEIAKPLTHDVKLQGNRDPRLFVRLSYLFSG